MNINNITLAGRLTRDPELRHTKSGDAICQISIAWNDYKKEGHFFDAVFFKKRGETVAQYFKRGDAIGITGELTQDRWEDTETGEKRSKIKIVGRDFSFGQKGGEEPQPKAQQEEDERLPF